MSNLSNFSGLEDEEDLETLRLAALQSLKKNAPLPDSNTPQIYTQPNPEHPIQFWQNKGYRNKKGKPFGTQYAGRGNRNFQGHFNRVRSANLISIPTLPNESEAEEKSNSTEIKLNLPQNRHLNKDEDGERSQDSSSKFDRYNISDKSESESENEDVLLSDEDSPPLKKSNSLEALMQELDNEILGKPVSEEKIKTKKTKKRKKEASTSETANITIVQENNDQRDVRSEAPEVTKEDPAGSTGGVANQLLEEFGSPTRKRQRSRSPSNRRNFFNRRRHRNYPHQQQQQNAPIMIPYGSGPVQFPPQIIPFNGQPFNPIYGPPGMIPNQPLPPFYENPLPPLTINPDPLPPTLAPLSPRSAAFVLENKAIIERRRRSPRRSYSRSPSRSHSRSLSPRRSPRWSVSPRRSPLRRLPPRKRSLSPKRKSISPRRKSLSPRRKSVSPRRIPLSPRRKSLSPRRKSISPRRKSVSPRRRSLTPRKKSLSPRSPNRRKSISPKRKGGDGASNRPPVRDRLGLKSRTEEKDKSKQPEDVEKKEEDKLLDPVLEARKRKFESNEIKMKEGIIRLKPKDDKAKEERPIETKQKEPKTKEERSKVDNKPREEKSKQEKPKPQPTEPVKVDKIVEKGRESRSTTPKPKESIVEVAPATTTTDDRQIDVPDEFKELEKLLLGGDDIELDPKVEDIFSDEDSASDNEGRFKVKDQKGGTKPPVIPFIKLVNGEKRDIKSEPLSSYTKNKDARDRTARDRPSTTRKRTSQVEKKEKKELTITQEKEKRKSPEKIATSKSLAKPRISYRAERPPPMMDKRFERKIEIKIKNPSKYERSGKSKIVTKNEVPSSSNSIDRKVSMDGRRDDSEEEEDDDDEIEPEIIVDNGSDEEYSNFNEGDLRAQLSKKRAEKLHKIPAEEVSSRLLKYALKGAVFKKQKKKSKDKDITSNDGKPPIHLRLGLGNQLELYSETRTKRKSRKRKNREVLEQV